MGTRMRGGHQAWHSPFVGDTMHVRWFGHGGARVLAFPTTMGDHNEWPNRYMPDVLAEHIRRGQVTLFCLDHNHDRSWYDRRISAGERARRHLAYDRYLRDELLPFTRQVSPVPFVIATGASFGAYHAMTFAMRNPSLVQRVIGMSGMYDIRRLTDGVSDDAVYLANPAEFVAREWQRDRLEAMQRMDIILAIGEDDPAFEDNREFSGMLWRKGIGNALRPWSGFAHDWPWWERMLLRYIGGHD
jgi:esterase/lipase superfamily enzyme